MNSTQQESGHKNKNNIELEENDKKPEEIDQNIDLPIDLPLPNENLINTTNTQKFKDIIKQHISGPFSAAILERKNQSFDFLIEWDQNKCDFLKKHKTIMDSISKKIDKKSDFLNESMKTIIKYFNMRVHQQNEIIIYYQKRIPKLGEIYAEKIKISPEKTEKNDFFPDFNKAFNNLDEMTEILIKKHEEYKEYIEKVVLKDNLLKENQEYDKEVNDYKNRIISTKKKIVKLANETAESSKKHGKLFQDMMNPTTRKETENKDLYDSQLNILKSSDEQLKNQRNLALELINYRESLLKLDENRFKLVQKVFQEYIIKTENFCGNGTEYDEMKKFFNQIEFSQNLKEYYSLNSIFNMDDIYNLIGNDEITNILEGMNLINMLHNFKLKDLEQDSLVLKQYIVERDRGTIYNDYRKCKICLTVDSNFLIFDDYVDGIRIPATYCLKMENLSANAKNEKGVIEIVEKTKGFIFNSSNKYFFKVENPDDYDELIAYVSFVKLRKWL